jgi:hypothetical protein
MNHATALSGTPQLLDGRSWGHRPELPGGRRFAPTRQRAMTVLDGSKRRDFRSAACLVERPRSPLRAAKLSINAEIPAAGTTTR